MKRLFIFSLLLLVVGCTLPQEIKTPVQEAIETTEEASEMKLTSSAFSEGGKIPAKYTCDGTNLNPPLAFSDVPAKAKGLVLIMDDPDAVKPAGKVWDHWVVFNIPPTTTEISEGKNPSGVLGRNTRGNNTYGGPCPPDREHRYFFKLYALDTELKLPEGSSKAEVENAMEGHILAEVKLMGRYERKN